MDAKTLEEIRKLNKKIDDLHLNKKNMTEIKFLEEKNKISRELEKLLPK
ncbi:MAG: hypothetical protein MUO82_06460 [Candidatus Thermoplasmatota archaeon]|nr:hypothetical protein [Candidatus Thermoplasmatota archaeon]